MSFDASIDLLIHLYNFKVIEKFGITNYRIEISAYYKFDDEVNNQLINVIHSNKTVTNDRIYFGKPYAIYNKETDNYYNESKYTENIYISKDIVPSLSNRTVDISEIVIFRFLVPDKENIINNEIFIDINLYLYGFKVL